MNKKRTVRLFIHNLFKIIRFYLENRVLLWYSIKQVKLPEK